LLGCAALVLLAGASGLAAETTPDRRLMSPLSFVQTLHGDVEMRSSGQTVVVTVRAEDGDHLFKVETDLLAGLPQLSATAAEVLFWRGHLVVTTLREGKAWHFSVPGMDALRNPEDPPLPGRALDARLRASYELTRIDTAAAITSRSGPGTFEGLRGVFDRVDTEYQDPTSGGTGGVGSCGASCTTTCGDGSSCSATCVPNRCASCSCPATCTCR
jgi:hypothetical protein